MSQTVAQLAARTLRKIGVAIVAESATQPDAVTFTAAALATRALRELGIIVPEARRPAALGTVAQAELAARSLRAVGVNPLGPTVQDNAVTAAIPAIALEALIRLGVIDPTETPEAQILTEAENAAQSVVDLLNQLNLANWASSAIPAYAVEPMIIMTVNVMGGAFGRPPANLASFDAAQDQLIKMALSGDKGQAIALAKIAAVHDAANALGLVSWTLDTVPIAFAEDYVEMAAALLSPVMGTTATSGAAVGTVKVVRTVDQAAWDAAEGRFRKKTMVAGAQALAQQRIADVQSELNAGNLVTWQSDQIPQSVADPIVTMTVQSMAGSFGGKFDPEAWALGIKRVRMVVMGGPAGQALAEQKVRAVHASLDARGKTRFSLFDLPDQFEQPYIQMAAYLLAPECDAKFDPNWWADGERQINQLVTLPTDGRPVPAQYF